MHDWLSTLGSYGYLVIFAALFVESLGFPAPDEFLLVGAGYLISQGKMSFPLAALTAVAGSTGGAWLAFSLARGEGRHLLERYGRRLGLGPERWHRAEAWFRHYGEASVILGRIVSGVRMFISYPAGLFGLGTVPFLGYTVIGSGIWAVGALSAGYYLGPHWGAIFHLAERYILEVSAVLLVFGGLIWTLRRKSPS